MHVPFTIRLSINHETASAARALTFLTQVVQGIKPRVALDYAMGDGRNSLYLAKLGWKLHGFDMSEVAVNIAKRHATELGLRIDAVTSTDANNEFGKERFDLILFRLVYAAGRCSQSY